MSAIRKPAVAAIDNRLLAPELAAGIARVKSAKSIGVRTVNRLPAGAGAPERAGHRDHPGAARLRALSGRIHGGGDGRPHHPSPIDLSLLRSGGSFGDPSQGPEFGNECHRRSTNPANQFFARGCSKPSSIQI
jgi:hypothetical protein